MIKLHSYKGREPYIFISYAHKDGDIIYPIIARLQKDRFRTWFDEGIDPGTEWDETIADSIHKCGYFIAFISNQYMESDNCKDELKYARDLKKKALLIYMEDVALTPGMAMRLNRLQSIYKFKYSDEEDFFAKLYEADGIEAFQSKPPAVSQSPKTRVAAPRKASSKTSFVATDWSDPANDPVTSEIMDAIFESKRPYLEKNAEAVKKEIKKTARNLMETLQIFRVKCALAGISRGPAVTRYEIILEPGTRIAAIADKTNEIALKLGVKSVRVVVIPGKTAIGVEVPNKLCETVHVQELLETSAFAEAKSKLTVALGVDITGAPVYFDIAKMPHLLIGGMTGMGKSACIHSMLASILCKASPDEVKLILIDPKHVEFSDYKGIPHLLLPVITDVWRSAAALKWAVTEMERRFRLLEAAGVRNIQDYNASKENESLPRLVIVIDEFADLMVVAPNAVEEAICRLAQMARAAGIHLILSTQRPSPEVITGIIKSNIPSRIAFATSSSIASRVILDAPYAEKLVGPGDMLFAPIGVAAPLRVQGAFIRESEIRTVTGALKQDGDPQYDEAAMAEIVREAEGLNSTSKDEWKDDSVDPLFRSALLLAVNMGKISTSLIQRNFKLGYGRAVKLIEQMEEKGYVGPINGQKPREVFLTPEQFKQTFGD